MSWVCNAASHGSGRAGARVRHLAPPAGPKAAVGGPPPRVGRQGMIEGRSGLVPEVTAGSRQRPGRGKPMSSALLPHFIPFSSIFHTNLLKGRPPKGAKPSVRKAVESMRLATLASGSSTMLNSLALCDRWVLPRGLPRWGV